MTNNDWTITDGYLTIEIDATVIFDCVSDGTGGFWWCDNPEGVESHIIYEYDNPDSDPLYELFLAAALVLSRYSAGWLFHSTGWYSESFNTFMRS